MRKIIAVLLLTYSQIGYSQNNAIDTILKLNLGGVQQTVLVRGKYADKPIILFLHGGPGHSEFKFFRSYDKNLEDNFINVNWDQRGAGLSYHDSIPASSMTIDQLTEDTHQLIQQLKMLYHKNKVLLVGHSFGSIIGLNLAHKFPQDVFAYVGVGQVINGIDNEKLSLAYTINEAKKRKDTGALHELREVEKVYPSGDTANLKYLYNQRDWLTKFGGVLYRDSTYDALIRHVDEHENNLEDSSKSEKGETFSMDNLWSQFLKVDFFTTIKEVKVPIYFFEGKADFNTPTKLVTRYVKVVKAPSKKIIWFYHSGHFPPFEEVQKFNTEVLNIAHEQKIK